MFGPKNFGPNDKSKMHPEDMRNMFIFLVLAALVFFSYDAFVLKPQAAAVKAQQAEKMKNIANELAAMPAPEVPLTRSEALAETPRIQIDNGRIKGSIALKGARLDDLALEEYYNTLEKKPGDFVMLLTPRGVDQARYIDHGWVSDNKNMALPGPETLWAARGNTSLAPRQPVTLFWNNGQGLVFEQTYTIDENYMMTLTQKIINNSGREVTLYPYGLISQKGIPANNTSTWIQIQGVIGYIGQELHEIAFTDFYKEKTQAFEATQGWLGINDKYWLTALVPPQGTNTKFKFTFAGEKPGKNQINTGRYQADFTGAAMAVKPGETAETQSHIFTGAKKVLTLEAYEKDLSIPNFNLAVNFGWFWFMAKPFFYLLHWLGQHIGNFGAAIIVLTVIVRMAVFPLTNLSYKSFAKMKKVAPQVAVLREQAGGDKAKLQAELVKMYEREGVNPMAGCLPILVQIPIFFALYKVLFVTIEMRHAPFFGWIQDLSAPDPTTIFNLFGLIPWDPPSFLHVGIWPCLLLLLFIVQKKTNPPPQDPIQRDMANYFPFIMTYMMAGFPSGLVIYWTMSALIGIIQQLIIMHRLGVPIHLFGQTEAEKKLDEQVAHGPAGVHPLAEMAEKEVEDALTGGDNDDEPKKISKPKPKKKKKKK
jgi:YidC/Oxa1 family membrane protein insertase